MELYAKVFWLPKHGNSKAEYEDAFQVAADHRRFAIADGATETSFSQVWAKQLVRAFTNGNLSVPLSLEELKPIQRKWQQVVRRHPLPWYAEEKASAGACAAFLGLEFSGECSDGKIKKDWRATAVGDSCIVQIRDDKMLQAFPVCESVSFTNSPILLCSTSTFDQSERDFVMTISGAWNCDDIFFLMTDALACWFFKECEDGNRPWEILRDLDTEGYISFADMIADLRSTGRIKNDDVTLLRIDVIR